MKLYRLLTGGDDHAFCVRVSEALNQGWELYGSPALTFDGTKVVTCQAIVKEAPGEFTPDVDMKNA